MTAIMRKSLVIGALAGFLGSIVPLEGVVLAGLGFALFLFVRLLWGVQAGFGACGIGAATAIAVMAAAVLVPVKPLNGTVGPMRYEAIRLDVLGDTMQRDWGLPFHSTSRRMVSFRTDEPMTRRAVLEKLARETGLVLHIRCCGNGATLLFGAACFPMMEEARPAPVP